MGLRLEGSVPMLLHSFFYSRNVRKTGSLSYRKQPKGGEGPGNKDNLISILDLPGPQIPLVEIRLIFSQTFHLKGLGS